MTLTDIMQAVEKLSSEEKQKLREYLEQGETSLMHKLSPEERARRLDEAAAKIREGLTQAQLDEMTRAMNEEYVEAVDVELWKD